MSEIEDKHFMLNKKTIDQIDHTEHDTLVRMLNDGTTASNAIYTVFRQDEFAKGTLDILPHRQPFAK